jgi:hypothetical protein
MPGSPQRRDSFARRARRAATVAITAAVVATGASSASARTSSVGFTSLPRAVFEGQRPTIAVAVQPTGERCTLTVDYPGNRTDHFQTSAQRGRAAWSIRIPAVPPGMATVVVGCGRAGSARGSMRIRWAVQAPKIDVTERGWSQRLEQFGGGSTVSFGLALRNERARSDAVMVAVLVNFVDASNRVLGSAQVSVMRIPASSTFYVGGQQMLMTQIPVARVEAIVSAKPEPREGLPEPLISDIGISPASDGYVSNVHGQLLNNYPRAVQSAFLGVVVRNAAGDIIGGGSTYASGRLSFGAREFFVAAGTFRAVPFVNAASADVSAVATWVQKP